MCVRGMMEVNMAQLNILRVYLASAERQLVSLFEACFFFFRRWTFI